MYARERCEIAVGQGCAIVRWGDSEVGRCVECGEGETDIWTCSLQKPPGMPQSVDLLMCVNSYPAHRDVRLEEVV